MTPLCCGPSVFILKRGLLKLPPTSRRKYDPRPTLSPRDAYFTAYLLSDTTARAHTPSGGPPMNPVTPFPDSLSRELLRLCDVEHAALTSNDLPTFLHSRLRWCRNVGRSFEVSAACSTSHRRNNSRDKESGNGVTGFMGGPPEGV